MTQTYYTRDIDGEYSVAQPQPTLREVEPEDIDDTMSVAERSVRIVLAKAKGVCLSKVHAIDHAGNSYLREASATQCANAIGALNIQPLIDQVHGILSLPTPAEPPADVARDIRLQVESEFAALLPGVTYMDEPDGGSPTVQEQVKRMARDAERYRWLRTHGLQRAWVSLGTDFEGDNFASFRCEFNLPEPPNLPYEDDEGYPWRK